MDRESNGQFVTFTRLVFTADVVTFSRKEGGSRVSSRCVMTENSARKRRAGKVSHLNIRARIKSSTDIYVFFHRQETTVADARDLFSTSLTMPDILPVKLHDRIIRYFFIESSLAG